MFKVWYNPDEGVYELYNSKCEIVGTGINALVESPKGFSNTPTVTVTAYCEIVNYKPDIYQKITPLTKEEMREINRKYKKVLVDV